MARKRTNLTPLVILLAVILAGLVALAIFLQLPGLGTDPTEPTPTVTDPPTDPPTEPPTEPPTDPPVEKTATATIGAMGDLLMHMPVVNGYYNNGVYNFAAAFQYLSPIVSKLDYAAINLETTLCGTDNGFPYQGYPNFNCPDAIVDGAIGAGFDMMLTANNHTYDTGHVGFHRTQQVIRDRGMDYIGTRMSEEEKNYLVKDLNGIRIGMICYTYNTKITASGQVDLNWGNLMDAADSPLINSFNKNQLDSFYQKLSAELAAMKADGAEALVLFIHWGDEYELTPNSTQKAIAQKLCDMGVDVIIGGHPHVVQPVELLTGTADESKKTLCIYSLGNAISNQRLGNVDCPTAHTEDGALFTVTFAKYSDGTVLVEATEVIPLWVNMYWGSNGKRQYDILPLDGAAETWQSAMNLSTDRFQQCLASYDRTNALVSAGTQAANDYFAANQAQVEAQIGVKKP